MTSRIFLTFYYFVIILITYSIVGPQFRNADDKHLYVWILSVLPKDVDGFLLITTIFTALISSAVSALIIPIKKIRAAVCFFFLCYISFRFSFGKVHHLFHTWILSSFLLIFFDLKKGIFEGNNKLIIRIIQTYQVMVYFCAGISKVFKHPEYLYSFDFIYRANMDNVAISIVSELIYYRKATQFFCEDHPWLLVLGFFYVILFQLSCGIVGFWQKGYFYAGIGALIFHMSTGLLLGIWSIGMVMASTFFLIILGALESHPHLFSSQEKSLSD